MISLMSDVSLVSRLSEVRRALVVKRRAEALVRGGPEGVASYQQHALRELLAGTLKRSSASCSALRQGCVVRGSTLERDTARAVRAAPRAARQEAGQAQQRGGD